MWLIDNLASWLNRKDGRIDYFLTRLPSVHGSFQSHLLRIGMTRATLTVYSTVELYTTPNTPFSLVKDGMGFVSNFVQTWGSSRQRYQRDVEEYPRLELRREDD